MDAFRPVFLNLCILLVSRCMQCEMEASLKSIFAAAVLVSSDATNFNEQLVSIMTDIVLLLFVIYSA